MSLTPDLEQKIESAKTLLQHIATENSPAAFANSFGAEDMVLMDLICKHAPAIEIFTLDTGRLHSETYQLMHDVRGHYGVHIKSYFPQREAIEEYLQAHGPNAFYESVELRKLCCRIRKVELLKRALTGKKAWITGLRREQAPTRKDLGNQEWDADNGLTKFNPLIDWILDDIWVYIRHYGVPYNPLHDQFFPSIGCAPCTRAVAMGEDIRAGRWWWENPETKECGLHLKKTARG